ncbi:hypothetical protein [Pseudoalteromonas sp. Ld20]|uniref:hypothetical protein n=1 Tax=Pseudoalteromonas sp. Ld20 TaxID=649165 RepID=UPI003867457E
MAVGQPAPTLNSGKVDAPEQFIIFNSNKRLVGLICLRIIMNCPICNSSDTPNFIKENFKYIFESSTSNFLSSNQEFDSELIFDSRLDDLISYLNKFGFSYRDESIKDISIYAELCSSCVVDAISALEDNPEQSRRKIKSSHNYETVPIHHFSLSYLNIKSQLDTLRANALLESYDFSHCSTVNELLNDTDISIKDFNTLVEDYFKIDVELFAELPKVDFYDELIRRMKDSEVGIKYKEQRPLYYGYDACELANATW